MKISSSLLLSIVLFALFYSTANSQSSDSCNTTIGNLNGNIPFDTTSFICNSVWPAQSFIIRYRQTGTNQWSFVLSAPNSNGYIAIGFSPSGQMIGSSAIAGWVGTNGVSTMKTYFLGGQSSNEVQPDSGNLQVGNSSITSTSTLIYMAFQLNTAMPETKVLYAVGQPNQIPSSNGGFRLSQHLSRISTALNYATGQSQTQASPYSRLKRSHGILNLVGWAILMSIGAIVARHGREWDPAWFYSHIAIQILGFILGIAGVVSGLVLNHKLGTDLKDHKAIGITVLVLGCLQAVAVLARPDKESKVRKYWNWYHHNAGRILIILSIANVFYGVHLAKAGKNWNVGFGVAIGILFAVSVILEIRLHMRK